MRPPSEQFRYIDPPFVFNAAGVAQYPPEVTGYHLLRSLCRRLGWPSLSRKRLLDFGCGVRFARTIYNLNLEIGLYAGIDVNAEAIAWLSGHVDDPRFRFAALDMRNEMYNPNGSIVRDTNTLREMGFSHFDAACMFSVITHQAPPDAGVIFRLLHEVVRPQGRLYFTAFTDDAAEVYYEGDPAHRCHRSTYPPDHLRAILADAGWLVEEIYPRAERTLQSTAFVCRKR